MDKVIRCHCGFEARSEHEDELIAEVQRHASESHGMALSHDEALLLAFRAELDHDVIGVQTRQQTSSPSLDTVIPELKEER